MTGDSGGGPADDRGGRDDELARLRAEVARLHDALESERAAADQWREVAEERRVANEKMRQHPLVRLLYRLGEWLLPVWRRGASRAGEAARRSKRAAAALTALPDRLDAPDRERRLAEAVAALPPPPETDRTATLVVLTHDGRDHLERLLPALLPADGYDVLVVDNASGEHTRAWLADHDVDVLRLDSHRSYAAANNAGAAAADGDTLVFLNDDVEPVSPGWLARLVAPLDPGEVVATGALLVWPRRSLLAAPTRDLGTQHAGIAFEPVPGGVPHPVNLGQGADPDPHAPRREVAAVTGACLAVDRAAFEAVGGFDEGYDFGAEDVDLCWRLRTAPPPHGGRIEVVPSAVLFHHEGATRHREDPAVLHARQQRNWDRFAARLGPPITRAVAHDRLNGAPVLATRPHRIAITVTRDLEEAGYGDYHTARELGAALADRGLDVITVERYRDAWYDLPDSVDTVISLLDTFDLRRVARPGLTTLAWVRNWTDRWTAHPWFDDYDIVLASSREAARRIAAASRHDPGVMPLATNPERFHPDAGDDNRRGGAVFAGSYWGRDTRLTEAVAAVPDLAVYGKGWDEVPAVAPRWRGQVPYDDLPAIYADAAVVVDQAAQHTRDEASVNSRVFDAAAAGAVPVTNQVVGARELFGDALPTWDGPEELAETVHALTADDDRRAAVAADLRASVLAEHTYADRAATIHGLLRDRAEQRSFVLATSVPERRVAERWGDWHLAEALARELGVRGHDVRVITRDEWDDRDVRAADVFVHLRGRSVAPRAAAQTHVIWNLSHPEELTPEECDAADLVLVASTTFAEDLRQRTSTPVEVLLQATDHRRFRPLPAEARYRHDVVFVGNSRFVERPVVRDALAAGLDPVVYGANWEKFLPPEVIAATHVPNDELPRVYSSARVVLNDHWDGMRRRGFVANRIFDVLACGGVVVSDEVAGLDELFDGAVATYRTADDLRDVVQRLLADDDERRDRGERGRQAVLDRHTFAHRAARLLALLDEVPDEVSDDVPGDVPGDVSGGVPDTVTDTVADIQGRG